MSLTVILSEIYEGHKAVSEPHEMSACPLWTPPSLFLSPTPTCMFALAGDFSNLIYNTAAFRRDLT
jgi:hypothetical protein